MTNDNGSSYEHVDGKQGVNPKAASAWQVDSTEFEKKWIAVCEQIIDELMKRDEIQQIKLKVRSQGRVNLEDRDKFIEEVNKIKYEIIVREFGLHAIGDFDNFLLDWKRWHEESGVKREKPQNMFEENIAHLMFGSTPNPDLFLRDFNVNVDI